MWADISHLIEFTGNAKLAFKESEVQPHTWTALEVLSGEVRAVPEPTSMLLVLGGAFLLTGRRRSVRMR
jgi:hypothetical protein